MNQTAPPEAIENSESKGSGPNLDVLQILKRHWALILFAVACGWGLAFAYWYVTPPTYESTASLLIMQKDPQLATRGANAAQASHLSEDAIATHLELLNSERIIREALEQFELGSKPQIVDKLKKDETPVDFVLDRLEVTRGGGGQAKSARVLNIAFRHPDPEFAKTIVEAILIRYRAFVKEQFEDANKEAAELIGQAQKEIEGELLDAEAELLEMRKDAPVLFSEDGSTNAHTANYEQIQAELGTLKLDMANARARLKVVQEAVKTMDLTGQDILEPLSIIDAESLVRLEAALTAYIGEGQAAPFQASQPERMAAAEAEYDGLLRLIAREKTLLQDFGPNYPEVQKVRQQIKTTREYLTKRVTGDRYVNGHRITPEIVVKSYLNMLQKDVESLKQKEIELLATAEIEEELAKEMVEFELDDMALRQQVERKQELYDAVVNRLRDINLAKDYGGFINEIIERPRRGVEVWPKLLILLALGTMLGMVMGSAGALALEFSDRKFRNADDVVDLLEVPMLAQVPSLKLTGPEATAAKRSPLDPMLCVHHAPRSTQAEVFRGLRTQLFFTAQTHPFKVLAVTSPKQGDGKSTMTANTALSIAQAGRRVLLVDADMRRPRVQVVFGLSNGRGLSEVLTGQALVDDCVHSTGCENLTVLTAGQRPVNPAELLESLQFEQFLQKVQEEYDLVILDCPPALHVADPCIVASRVDGVILGVRVTQDSKPEALHARDLILQAGGTIYGTVLNCWDAPREFFTSGGYGYTYGYEYTADDGGADDDYENFDPTDQAA